VLHRLLAGGLLFIAILLLKSMQMKSLWQWNLSNLAAMRSFNLLTCRGLWTWLADTFEVPIREPDTVQLTLAM